MTSLMMILLLGGGLALLLLIIGLVVTLTGEQSLVDKRLAQYTEEEVAVVRADGEKASPVGDWLNVQLERSSWGDGLSKELARADLKLRAGEYILLMLFTGAFAGLIAWYVGGRSMLFSAIGVLVGINLPRIYVRRQQAQRLVNFNNQLADMLNLMVNGLRAGYSTMQALEAISKELPPPISSEFLRVVQEMQLGIPIDQALNNLLRRIPSDDLELVITAINVQREVGGNLAVILEIISHTIRERVRVKGEIKVLTSQVMYSGRFLAIMPLLIIAALYLMNRPYMMEFINPETRVVGLIALTIAGLMVVSGYFVMTRIANIDVCDFCKRSIDLKLSLDGLRQEELSWICF
ncbi:MAG: type II secretion system F family protein [Anaerolineales bacterium]|nr:type II secretion system F family protein [Anaerolineales bacterium]